MDITPLAREGHQIIGAYGDGGFRIAGARHEGSALVFATETLAWPVAEFAALSIDSLAPVLSRADELDLVVVGTGARLQLIGQEIRDAFKAQGVGLEAMDTGAACRTFNVLLLEERRLAAALIAVD